MWFKHFWLSCFLYLYLLKSSLHVCLFDRNSSFILTPLLYWFLNFLNYIHKVYPFVFHQPIGGAYLKLHYLDTRRSFAQTGRNFGSTYLVTQFVFHQALKGAPRRHSRERMGKQLQITYVYGPLISSNHCRDTDHWKPRWLNASNNCRL